MRGIVVLVVFGFVVGSAAPAHAGLSGDLAAVKERIEALREQVGDSEQERTELANRVLAAADELEDAVGDLDRAEAVLVTAETELDDTQGRVDELVASIEIRTAAIEAMQAEMTSLREAARERAVELYMEGDPAGGLDLFELDDVSLASVGRIYAERVQQVVDRDIARFAALSARRQEFVDRLEVEASALSVRAADLEVQILDRARIADAVGAQASVVESHLVEQQAVLDEFDDEVRHIEGEIAGLAREQRRIEEQIAYEQALAGRRPGNLLRPVAGGVSSAFGPRVHPILGDVRMHTGWDMNAGCREPIRAAEAGRVFVNGWQGGYGLTVMIDHGGGMSTLYAHQTETNVVYGQQVALGDIIGYIGSTGLSTACHLHFEVRLAGRPVDPADYV